MTYKLPVSVAFGGATHILQTCTWCPSMVRFALADDHANGVAMLSNPNNEKCCEIMGIAFYELYIYMGKLAPDVEDNQS